MAGVSENILMGQLCPVGTGAFSLMLDEDKLAGEGEDARCLVWAIGWVGGSIRAEGGHCAAAVLPQCASPPTPSHHRPTNPPTLSPFRRH